MAAIILLFAAGCAFVYTVPVARSVARFAMWRLQTKTTVTSLYAYNGDVKIHYTTIGDGPALVLLHGGLSSDLDWIGEIPVLANDFRLIVIDSRGHGKSDLGTAPLTYRLMASDVAVVMDAAGLDQADVAGWSDGGNTGLLLAIEFPNRVKRLIAISANFHPDGIPDDIKTRIDDAPDASITHPGRWIYRLRSPTPKRWPDLVQRVTDLWASYPQLTDADLIDVTAPTLIIVGSKDYVERSHSEQLANCIPNSTLTILPGIGHSVTRDAPEEVSREIINFLAR